MHIEQHRQAGRPANAPALYATVDPDHDIIEVHDGVGVLLAVDFDQAERLAVDIAEILEVVRSVAR